jgi:glycosyltransferase involved in cell wall biosynthesis
MRSDLPTAKALVRSPAQALSGVGRKQRAPWLLIAEGFHKRGGMEKANHALASYLVSQRIPVHLAAFSVDPELSARPAVTSTIAPTMGRWPSVGRFHLARIGHALAQRVTAKWPDARVLVNGINCEWPDINWVHWVHHCWQERILNAPLWFRVKHRLECSRAVSVERTALNSTKLIVANSNRTRRDLIDLLGLADARIHTIYLGSDSAWKELSPERRVAARAWLQTPLDRPLVSFVGALGHDSRKGFDTLWQAWTDLCRLTEWDAHLVVAGTGRALPKWRREAIRSGLGGRVRFLGFTGRISDVLAASDLLVSPVRYEPYGLNVQEALSFGVPALVIAEAGVAERYPPELSPLLLPNPEDSFDLATRMLNWSRDKEAWSKRIEPTTRMLRSYTWDDMASRIAALAECSRSH